MSWVLSVGDVSVCYRYDLMENSDGDFYGAPK